MIDLPWLLKYKYPDCIIGESGDILLQDHGDGGGAIIGIWNRVEDRPTKSQLEEWINSPEVINAHQLYTNAITNAPIYKELENLDLKTIRALRTNDTSRLNELEQRAEELRQQLLPTR
jgi:hypothetical protein